MIMEKSVGRKAAKLCTTFEFDLKHIETFCVIVELESFSRAAEALYITQASASERIAKLEKALGTRLLDRLGRKIVPSKAGQMLYERASKLLEMKRQTCLEIENFLGFKRGNVSIGGSTIPGEYILPAIIGKFRKEFPEISVHLVIGDTIRITRGTENGEFEFGVVGSRYEDECLEYRKLWKDNLVLVLPKGHHMGKNKSLKLKDISEEPFILREKGSGTRKILEERLKQLYGLDFKSFNVVAELGSSTAIKEGIKKGIGISFLSSWSIESEIKTGELIMLPVKDFKVERNFYIVRDKRRACSPLCKALQDFLVDQS
jgi:DNA-binding transcriptional LysR family regulator